MVAMTWSELALSHLSFEDLSVQSLDAAIDLDRLQRGEEVDVALIRNFASNLGFQASKARSDDALKRYTDPRTVDVYSRTFTHLTNARLNTIGELTAKIDEIADAFTKDITVMKDEELKKMRDFCLALHRELLAETYNNHTETTVDGT